MRTRIFAIGMLILLGAAAAITAQTQTATDRLASAENAKRNKGPEAAIPIYDSVCRDFPNDGPNCTKALVGIVKAYGYLEDADKVRDSCQRLIAQYGDQPEVPADVRALCAPAKPRTRSGIFVADMDLQTGVIHAPARSVSDVESYETGPTFSPDGRLISFKKYLSSATQAGIDKASIASTVWVRSLDSKSERMINTCGSMYLGRGFWPPDGKSLLTATALSASQQCINRSVVQTGEALPPAAKAELPLDVASMVTLSTDGAVMSYMVSLGTDGAHFVSVYIGVDSTTGTPKQAFTLPLGPDEVPVPRNVPIIGLSPDGRTAAAIRDATTADARLVRFDIDGNDRHYQELVVGIGRMGNVVWGKDGKRIFFARSTDGNIWQIMQVSAEGGRPSFTGLEVTGLRYFDVNRDNTQIAFDGLVPTISAPESYVQPPVADASTPSVPALPLANAPAPARGGARGNVSASSARGQVVVIDRNGNVVTRLPDPVPTQNAGLSLSPDGTRVAVVSGGSLINIEIASNMATLVASNVSNVPAWSPNGKRMAYRRSADNGSLYVRSADGTGPEELLHIPVSNLWNWSFDGRFILIGSGGNLVALSPDAGKTLTPVPGLAGGTGSRLSPDSKFIAYGSASIGAQVPVFVRPIDSVARAVRIADGSVGMIRWKSDGKEVYYLGVDGGVWSVGITATTSEIKAGSPVRLFAVPSGFTLQNGVSGALADVSANGQRFAFLAPLP